MAYTKVTGALVGSLSDLDLTNVGDIQLDSISGDADTNTSITFSGSDVITIATGGSGRLTISDGALSPVTDNQIDLGTSSLEFKDAYFDGTVTADAFAGPLTGTLQTAAQTNITSVGNLTALTVQKASSGATATSNTVATIEDDDNTELSILGGSSSVLAINFGHSGDPDDGIITYNTTNNSETMGFTVNAAERISINKDGKVSFGSNAENKLHFEESGVTHWLIYPYDHTNSHYPSLYLGNSGSLKVLNTGAVQIGNDNDGVLVHAHPPDGHVGVGTASPTDTLHVKSAGTGAITSLRLENSNTSVGDGSRIMFTAGTSTSGASISGYGTALNQARLVIEAHGATHAMDIGGNSGNDMHIFKNSADCRIRGGVYGSLFDSNANMNTNIRFAGTSGLYFNVGPSTAPFVFEQQGTGRFTINSSGGSNGSDIKLKEDITYGLDTVKQLQPRKFDWKGEDIPADEKAGIGFIAQEVESIIPELVSDKEHADGPENNTKFLNYGSMTSVLVKAIQELNTKLEAAEARIKNLEG